MSAKDTFAGVPASYREAPANHAAVVTPNDSTDLAFVTRAIYCGDVGNIKVDTLGGDTAVVIPMLAGGQLDIRVKRVYSTGTTVGAGKIIALW